MHPTPDDERASSSMILTPVFPWRDKESSLRSSLGDTEL
jgi:hypothetical protein